MSSQIIYKIRSQFLEKSALCEITLDIVEPHMSENRHIIIHIIWFYRGQKDWVPSDIIIY